MQNIGTFALALTFLGISGIVLAIQQLCRRDQRVDDRVKAFGAASAGSVKTQSDRASGGFFGLRAAMRVAALLMPRNESQRSKHRLMLVHAGFYSPSAPLYYVVAQIGIAAWLFAAGVWTGRMAKLPMADQLLCGAIAGCVAFLFPCCWLRRRKLERIRVLNRSMPDLLDLMVTCLDAGLSLEAVIQRVTQEIGFAHPVLADELLRVQREIELGAPPDRALQSFADRTDAEVVRSLATVCHQSRKYGARISESLRGYADLLRDQREQNAEEAAQKASVKILFPTLLCLFPAIFVVLAGPAAIQISENFTSQRAQDSAAQTSTR